ncbi:hypothetical protein M569_16170 [Genlisea aurea]|uniref:PPIase cyclophilin-type domain-containing protein n=1 Tax=Genlisea aurea TaxID=192259 RepID=S8D7H0_9LAMI|nr:hypothetical protein M569_16170 [Genlisea aurea]
MSTVYVLEPPTKGKVIITTSYGPLDIELWPKEAPKAVRNFVQLCLEGYYDGTVFHRVIKSFLVQGGDPTGTGEGGESIYGSVFPDEFHSRLRFKHRGLVACAGAGSANSNGSQFFVTLDRCDFLDKKHTIFGKVTGDSIFNLIQLGEIETDKDDRPLEPLPKILSVEVLWNPFDDIVPRTTPAESLPPPEKNETKVKATKNFNLLSFGEEAEEEEKELAALDSGIKSSHDVLDDPRLLKEDPENVQSVDDDRKAKDVQLIVREALSSKKDHAKEPGAGFPESLDFSDEDESTFDARMRQQILKRRKDLGDFPSKDKSPDRNRAPSTNPSVDHHHDEKPKADKLSFKKRGIGSEAKAERLANADVDLQLLGEAERERYLLKQQKKRRRKGHEEEAIFEKLEKFKSVLSTISEGPFAAEEDDSTDWTGIKLKFAVEPNKGNMSRSDDPNDYTVLDPLWEKGKEKFNKMMAKDRRRQREWAGKSLT